MEENQSNEASQVEIQARLENKVHELRNELFQLRTSVRDWFQGRYEDYDFADEFEISVDDINELLGSINASQLDRKFEGTITLELSFEINATNREEAEALLESTVSDFGYSDGLIEVTVGSTYFDWND